MNTDKTETEVEVDFEKVKRINELMEELLEKRTWFELKCNHGWEKINTSPNVCSDLSLWRVASKVWEPVHLGWYKENSVNKRELGLTRENMSQVDSLWEKIRKFAKLEQYAIEYGYLAEEGTEEFCVILFGNDDKVDFCYKEKTYFEHLVDIRLTEEGAKKIVVAIEKGELVL